MLDKSLYEKSNRNRQEQAFGICLGTIVAVNSEERTCSVSTFAGSGSMQDQYIDKCQWLCADSNPDGDESGSIPRRGSMGLVFFVDGEAFIWGYLRPLWKNGDAAKGGGPTLVEGDKIMSTLQGNRIAVKRSGLIELYASESLRRQMMPNGGRIIDICRDYNLNCMGSGIVRWGTDRDLGTTLYEAEYRRNTLRDIFIQEKKGYVSNTLISKTAIGPSLPCVKEITTPSYVETISTTGEKTTVVMPPSIEGTPSGYKSVMSPDGTVSIKAGAAHNVSLDITSAGAIDIASNELFSASVSETGDFAAEGPVGSVSVDSLGNIEAKNAVATISMSSEGEISFVNKLSIITISSSGDVSIEAPLSTLKMTAAGEVSVESDNKIAMNANAGIEIKTMGELNLESLGPTNIKAKGMVMIDGGSGIMEGVLTNPSTISPFTGSPLVPFSTTVKVSK